MALLGDGVLLTFTEVPEALEEDFNEWYNREHLDERVGMPGFRRARRYVSVEGGPKYFASYETGAVEDLATPEYLAVLADQTDWSKRVMAGFTVFERLTCRLAVDLTTGIGGAVTLVRCFPAAEAMDDFRAWLAEEALPSVIARPNLLGACVWRNDLHVANAPARARGLDYPQPEAEEWVIAIDAAEAAAGRDAAARALDAAALGRFGVDPPPAHATYQMLYANHR